MESGEVLDALQHPLVGPLRKSLFHPPESHVRQILHPLEVRDSHTASVRIDVWNNERPTRKQPLARIGRHRTVRSLDDYLRADSIDVLGRDLVFQRGRDENVAIQLESLGARCDVAGAGEAKYRPGFLAVRHDVFQVEPGFAENRTLSLSESDENPAAFLNEFCCVVTHVAEALDDYTL